MIRGRPLGADGCPRGPLHVRDPGEPLLSWSGPSLRPLMPVSLCPDSVTVGFIGPLTGSCWTGEPRLKQAGAGEVRLIPARLGPVGAVTDQNIPEHRRDQHLMCFHVEFENMADSDLKMLGTFRAPLA